MIIFTVVFRATGAAAAYSAHYLRTHVLRSCFVVQCAGRVRNGKRGPMKRSRCGKFSFFGCCNLGLRGGGGK